ncbi:MAG: RNA polymerase factor sigma-54 [Thiobacillus sp. 63-78]|uniref:RNA polymerase factor sigma-54 n=1 Tax=Thiobacillus sp. 63-78 TaxID=1895859 RepID=UPI00095CD12F|nr:RNA polymerase factor sigma-54 [Thiobacillus sp. 63-78]MBN8763144.1 RNA polymerase factor sigma-54 [Thiobacillus sp.]MBN8766619.1 RNA polymerase factor sigma-54 [Thiobacillus sp.]MBN8774753.1 RNA polymerase factor sigma-54 [Thiobacillus sp.]OJZ11735.1 MAG: RNA polymerase factor sigma-54 [Thiobacillus sp. 63-78]
MKHSLQLKLGQHLTLTPQLQQSIRLLQLSTLELNQELEQMLQDNPLLEREEEDEASPAATETPAHTAEAEIQDTDTAPPEPGEPEPSATLDDADWNDYSVASSDDEDNDYTQGSISGATLREHLLNQLIVSPLTLRDRTLVAALIDDLDDSGFLTQPLEDITASLQGELEELEPEELDIALKHLQNMDPTGVGARNLAECLTLQLRALPPDTPARDAAMRLTTHYLDLLAARDVGKLKKMLGIDDAMLRAARALILSLNPRPGAAFGADDTHYVIPDVYVRKIKGMWIASLNADAMPKLRVNRVYADILSRHRESGGNQLASQLQEARWLIKNVQQRFDTILRVSQAIVDRQKQFFEHGEVAMRPLVLREIADAVELHESTISRVTTQKYMMTPRGLYELKYFFGSHVSTDSGGACSSTAIRALIKQLVAAESTKKPLSDGQLAGVLGQQGIVVARRTVAKYRESLQIPPANMRRAL